MGRLDPENTVQAAELSPEDYRRRYFALKETGQKRGSAVLRRLGNPRDLPEEWVVLRETLPAGLVLDAAAGARPDPAHYQRQRHGKRFGAVLERR